MESITRPKYEYSPLPGANFVRLLRLDARVDGRTTLSGSLVFRDLDNSEPEYTSLSYTWGRNSDGDAYLNRAILLDGRELSITENLYDFLVQVSKPSGIDSPLLWIDAICIDQQQLDERGKQVSIMAAIYQKASNLVIWLGHGVSEKEDSDAMEALSIYRDGTPDAEYKRHKSARHSLGHLRPEVTGVPMSKLQTRALRKACQYGTVLDGLSPSYNYRSLLWPTLTRFALADFSRQVSCRQLVRRWDPRGLFLPLPYHSTYSAPKYDSDAEILLDALGRDFVRDLVTTLATFLGALMKLCERRYFARRWVLQEVYQSRPEHMVLRWGSFSVSVSEFCDRLTRLDSWLSSVMLQLPSYLNVGSISRTSNPGRDAAFKVLRIRESSFFKAMSNKSERILECILTYKHTLCEDDRDRVYAFLSIAGPYRSLSADYNLSIDQAFVALSSALVKEGATWRSLWIASWQRSERHRMNFSELSIYATLPSWVADLRCALPDSNDMQAVRRRMKAGGPGDDCEASVPDDGQVLQLRVNFGQLTLFGNDREEWRKHNESIVKKLKGARNGDYIIWPPKWCSTGFILRDAASRPAYYTLIGYWEGSCDDKEVLAYCDKSVMTTIRLC